MTDDAPVCEVSDEAFAALADRVAELAEAVRLALSHEALATTINSAIHPVIVALAVRQRDTGEHTIH